MKQRWKKSAIERRDCDGCPGLVEDRVHDGIERGCVVILGAQRTAPVPD